MCVWGGGGGGHKNKCTFAHPTHVSKLQTKFWWILSNNLGGDVTYNFEKNVNQRVNLGRPQPPPHPSARTSLFHRTNFLKNLSKNRVYNDIHFIILAQKYKGFLARTASILVRTFTVLTNTNTPCLE